MSDRIRDLRNWSAGHPEVLDGAVAGLLLVLSLIGLVFTRDPDSAYRHADALNGLIVTLMILSLIWRQRFPLAVLAWVVAGEAVLMALDYGASGEIFAYLIAVYTVAAHRPLARSALGGAAALAALEIMMLLDDRQRGVLDMISNTILFCGVWWLGRSLRLRRSYLAELEDRAARLEKARFADARAARVEERSRIARELHDVVAHHVSVMTVQAGAARRIMAKDPESAREAIETIEQVGRTALSEMRRIVGVLRTDRDVEQPGAELAPQPGMEDLAGLIEQIRETGLAVQLDVDGDPRKLSTGVDLAAYRLIQEALTNSLKHAGPHARAWVHLRYTDRSLTLEVVDNGRGVAASMTEDPDTPGHGLVGMRERVALYGGELRIGPRIGGGFEVRARFPLEV
ncbi:sensor histidine kinase [Actinocorallia longicatena]|uniref:histidine kinase n=1 Tax=Actinocorallia longicatena TaxID=111803 RepID=A0ABP6Q5F7_9ACTN